MKTFTPTIEKQITQDWTREMVAFGVYEPLHLMRIVGPVVEGILLEKDSSNKSYLPTFHLHFLTKPFPAISLAVKEVLKTERTHAPHRIAIDKHKELFADAIERFRKKVAFLPLVGDVAISDVVAACWQQATANPNFYRPDLFENAVFLNLWAGRMTEAIELFERALTVVTNWPPEILVSIGGLDAWHSSVSEKIQSASLIRETVSEQLSFHHLKGLPTAKLI